jgi:hypothetical protein
MSSGRDAYIVVLLRDEERIMVLHLGGLLVRQHMAAKSKIYRDEEP